MSDRTIDDLKLKGAEFNSIVVSDERHRERATWDSEAYPASITLGTQDESTSWGEGLTMEDVAALHAWTGALLADHYAPPSSRTDRRMEDS